MKILNFGSLNLDYVYRVDHILIPGETQTSICRNIFCGGKGLNQSIALARAGCQIYHAGMIGDEGEILRKTCQENGVNTEFIKQISGPSGHTIIQVDQNGQNCILLFSGANRMITKEFVDTVFSKFHKNDVILLQNEINQLDYIIDRAYKKQMMIILNPSPFDSKLDSCDLSKVNLFLVNEIEGFQITGKKNPEEILKKMKELYPNAKVVLTLGGDGALYQDGEKIYCQETYKVDTVDTTAAGDTFTGYFISSVIEGIPVEEGLQLAAKAAAIAVSRSGATASIPWKNEVVSWKQEN